MEENNLCTLYIVRHGQTEWNKNHINMGQLDSPLTELGIEQAKETAEKLKGIKFDAIFSSDSDRAHNTAKILKLERELEIQTSKLLRERTYGHFEGKPDREYKEAIKHLLEEAEKLTEKEQWTYKFGDDVESDEELVNRFMVKLREISVAYPSKTVLVTTHGGCIRTFLRKTGTFTKEELPGGSFKNAGYVKVLSDGVDFFVKEVHGVRKPEGAE